MGIPNQFYFEPCRRHHNQLFENGKVAFSSMYFYFKLLIIREKMEKALHIKEDKTYD